MLQHLRTTKLSKKKMTSGPGTSPRGTALELSEQSNKSGQSDDDLAAWLLQACSECDEEPSCWSHWQDKTTGHRMRFVDTVGQDITLSVNVPNNMTQSDRSGAEARRHKGKGHHLRRNRRCSRSPQDEWQGRQRGEANHKWIEGPDKGIADTDAPGLDDHDMYGKKAPDSTKQHAHDMTARRVTMNGVLHGECETPGTTNEIINEQGMVEHEAPKIERISEMRGDKVVRDR